MKKIILSFSFVFVLLNVQVAQNLLDNIEERIYSAYGKSLQSDSDQHQLIIEELELAHLKTPDDNLVYWMAFSAYRSAIFNMNQEDREVAKTVLNKGITLLESLENPTSEHFALHGSMMSLSITFQRANAAVLSSKAAKLYEKAIELNDQNLRAYLGVGRSDYYTPKKYGGGLKVESYLKKALNKPDASTDDPFAPTWGRDDAYYYLASYYKREGRIEEAKLYCRKGLKKTPNHFLLNALNNELQ